VRRQPDSAEKGEAVFSIVIDDTKRRLRQLPTLFFGKARLFAHRDVAVVRDRLSRTVRMVFEAVERPVYLLHPCDWNGRKGLYGRDFYNRSSYRKVLVRHGMTFAEDSYVRLSRKSLFECPQWGEIRPSFTVLGEGVTEGPSLTAAFALYMISLFQIGTIKPADLRGLARTVQGMKFLHAEQPEALIELLSAH
jgi:hypothetical protein